MANSLENIERRLADIERKGDDLELRLDELRELLEADQGVPADDDSAPPVPKLIVKWKPEALKILVDKLAGYLEYLDRIDDLGDRGIQMDEFLEPYGLSREDDYTVTMLAMGKQCVGCGDLRDYYVVHDDLWEEAGLKPDQCCCRKCLSVRLGRPLERSDFSPCLMNYQKGLLEPIDASRQCE